MDILKTLLAFECFSLTLGGERVNQVKVLKTTALSVVARLLPKGSRL